MQDLGNKMGEIANDAGKAWGWFSQLIRARPKMGFFVGIALGVVLTHYGLNLVW